MTRDPILKEFLLVWSNHPMSKTQLATKSGIATTTLRNWSNGKTLSPKVSTMRMALHTLGYRIVVEPRP